MIATWIPATRQIIDDMVGPDGLPQSSMPYYVNLGEEQQLLRGDGTGENLHGYSSASDAISDRAVAVVHNRTRLPSALPSSRSSLRKNLNRLSCIMHPNNWFNMRLLKDRFWSLYVGRSRSSSVRPSLFGLDVVATPVIASRVNFSSARDSPIASEIRDRMEMQVEISTEHSTYFVQNMVAVRAEKRLALIVKRPASYIVGSFATHHRSSRGGKPEMIVEFFGEGSVMQKRDYSFKVKPFDERGRLLRRRPRVLQQRRSRRQCDSCRVHSKDRLRIAAHTVPLLWQHTPMNLSARLTLPTRPLRLKVRGQLLMELPMAQKACTFCSKNKIIKGLSIGYDTLRRKLQRRCTPSRGIEVYGKAASSPSQ